jgi:hypothetical protein
VKAQLFVDVVADLPRRAPREAKEFLARGRHVGSSTLNTASA